MDDYEGWWVPGKGYGIEGWHGSGNGNGYGYGVGFGYGFGFGYGDWFGDGNGGSLPVKDHREDR